LRVQEQLQATPETEKMKVHKVCSQGYNSGTVCSGRE